MIRLFAKGFKGFFDLLDRLQMARLCAFLREGEVLLEDGLKDYEKSCQSDHIHETSRLLHAVEEGKRDAFDSE